MAGKPKDMNIVKQVFTLHRAGKGKKTIARQLGISKNTVKNYLSKLDHLALDVADLVAIEAPVLEAKLFAGSPSFKDDRYEVLRKNFEYYASELNRVGVTKYLLWEEYKEKYPSGYERSQFCFHLSKYLKTQKPSMILQHQVADKLFIDFAGKKLSYIDPETGEVIECQVFVACLPYSDYCFAMAVHSQSIPDFIYALECCLQHLGGVPQTLVPDNLKAAIIKANNFEPQINQTLNDFANHYHTTVTPTRARKPKDKALVENQVKVIYSRVYARLRDQQFFSLSTLNQAIKERIKAHNQTRMQKKDYCREERFLAEEKRKLKALPIKVFEIKYHKDLKVAQNNHVYLSTDKRYYSVPYIHIGARSKVIYTRSLVTIYVKGERVASHHRVQSSGYSTIKEHLCSHHRYYLERSPKYYLNRAKNNLVFHRFIDLIFSQENRYPEQLYKICDGLFSLYKKSDPQAFSKAILKATDLGQYSYQFVKNIINNKTYHDQEVEGQQGLLPQHHNTRGSKYYQ